MRKTWILLCFSCLLVVLAACGGGGVSGDTDHSHMDHSHMDHETDMLTPVEVVISTEPGNVQANKAVSILATVTQGDHSVEQADEVQFEIWKEDEEDKSEIIDNTSQETGGIYSIEYTFLAPGTYYVIAHVTAEGMHTMPRKEIVVE